MVKLKKKTVTGYADNPIRRCSAICYFFKNGGTGCEYYRAKQVKFTDACMFDLVQMKRYSDAFMTGETKEIKEDASRITASLISQVFRMLEQVTAEGVTVDEPMVDAKGNPIWIPDPTHKPKEGEKQRMMIAMRKKEHPLIARSMQLSKSLGINLGDFKLTPKSADEKKEVSGKILVDEQLDLNKVMEDRKKTDQRFLDALKEGNRATLEDPIYKQLMAEGTVIDGTSE